VVYSRVRETGKHFTTPRGWEQALEHLKLWAQFGGAALLVVVAGVTLTKAADRLSDRFHLGKAFTGFLLLGWATSLPELVLSVGSAVRNLPGLAAGNIFGSCAFNLAIIALYDLVQGRGSLLAVAGRGLKLTGVLSAAMITLGACGLLFNPGALGGSVSPITLAIIALYALSITVLYLNDRRGRMQLEATETQPSPQAPPSDRTAETRSQSPPPSGRRLALSIVSAVVVIMIAGLWLTRLGEQLADQYSLSQSFVGAVFLAVTSSLPELVTGIAAIRMKLYGMAIGSIFGSNIFNIAILGIADLANTKGSLFALVKESNQTPALLVAAAVGIAMTIAAIFGLKMRSNRSVLGLGWDVIAMLAIYGVGAVVMMMVGAAAG